MAKEDGGSVRGVNWTIVAVIACITMILVILGPLVWRLVVQANADDMRVVGILLIVLVTFAVFVLALMGGMWAFSRMALRSNLILSWHGRHRQRCAGRPAHRINRPMWHSHSQKRGVVSAR